MNYKHFRYWFSDFNIVILRGNHSTTTPMENNIVLNQNNGEIILYEPNGSIRLEVRMQEETVWLTQAQMGQLFGCSTDNVGLHLKNLYTEGEIDFPDFGGLNFQFCIKCLQSISWRNLSFILGESLLLFRTFAVCLCAKGRTNRAAPVSW